MPVDKTGTPRTLNPSPVFEPLLQTLSSSRTYPLAFGPSRAMSRSHTHCFSSLRSMRKKICLEVALTTLPATKLRFPSSRSKVKGAKWFSLLVIFIWYKKLPKRFACIMPCRMNSGGGGWERHKQVRNRKSSSLQRAIICLRKSYFVSNQVHTVSIKPSSSNKYVPSHSPVIPLSSEAPWSPQYAFTGYIKRAAPPSPRAPSTATVPMLGTREIHTAVSALNRIPKMV